MQERVGFGLHVCGLRERRQNRAGLPVYHILTELRILALNVRVLAFFGASEELATESMGPIFDQQTKKKPEAFPLSGFSMRMMETGAL